MPTLTNRWAVLGLLFFVGIVVPMQFQSVAVYAPILTRDEGLSYTQVGILAGLFMLPGAFVALPTGILGVWIGDRAVMAIGLSVMLLGSLVFGFGGDLTIMSVGRLLAGAGAAILFVQRIKVVTDWFVGREISTAMAITAVSFGFGVGLAGLGQIGGDGILEGRGTLHERAYSAFPGGCIALLQRSAQGQILTGDCHRWDKTGLAPAVERSNSDRGCGHTARLVRRRVCCVHELRPAAVD